MCTVFFPVFKVYDNPDFSQSNVDCLIGYLIANGAFLMLVAVVPVRLAAYEASRTNVITPYYLCFTKDLITIKIKKALLNSLLA